MNIKKHIPNFLTCCNLICGILGITFIFAAGYDLTVASFFIYVACVFDFLDGFVARALKVSSPIGKELDSLADMVTFGVLPGFILASMLGIHNLVTVVNIPEQSFYFTGQPESNDLFMSQHGWKISFLAFLIPVFSAIRLAKFNIDTRQTDRFIGLPTPANALFISALPFLMHSEWSLVRNMSHPGVILIMIPTLSYLLVAELRLIALKFKNYSWTDNKLRYILIISAIVLLLTLNFTAIPIIIILYIILSIIENKFLSVKAKE